MTQPQGCGATHLCPCCQRTNSRRLPGARDRQGCAIFQPHFPSSSASLGYLGRRQSLRDHVISARKGLSWPHFKPFMG